jgi:hypothetical protein
MDLRERSLALAAGVAGNHAFGHRYPGEGSIWNSSTFATIPTRIRRAGFSVLSGLKTVAHLGGINRKPEHLARNRAFDLFDFRVDYDKARAAGRAVEKIGPRSIRDLSPDSLHCLGIMEEEFGSSRQIDDKGQGVVEKHPLHERVGLDLRNLAAGRGGQRVEIRKIAERHRGHPSRLRKPVSIDGAQDPGIVGFERFSHRPDYLFPVARIERLDVGFGSRVHATKNPV